MNAPKPQKPAKVGEPTSRPTPELDLGSRHLYLGWMSLLIFLSLGIVLEALHGFKVTAYLGVANSTRRLMWTLAHAHGTLLGLLHIAFAVSLPKLQAAQSNTLKLASGCLMWSGILIPAGFFLGGVSFHDGNPGLGILLLPFGAALLFTAVLLTFRSLPRRR